MRAGDVLWNTLTGEKAMLVESPEENGGARIVSDFVVEELTVEPGTWHEWWNAGEGEVRIRARIEPAMRFAEALMVFWGLCTDGHTDSKGRPAPLPGALLATRYRAELRYRQPPDVIQRLLFPALAAVARRRGWERRLDRYLDPEAHPSAEAGRGSLPDHVMRR
jgi:hypothetical protein